MVAIVDDVIGRRLVQLYAGLVIYGLSMALMFRGDIGLDPWDVFHQGASQHLGWSFGTVTIATGAAVLLLWIPLRQRPGLGTVNNVVVIGLAVDLGLSVLPVLHALPLRVAVFVLGVVLNGIASGAYIGARLGPGPRDGLMTGLVRRTGWRIRTVRTGIEVGVLSIGWLLGGTLGPGTVLYAVAIGPLVQLFLPRLTVPERRPPAERAGPAGPPAATGPGPSTPAEPGAASATEPGPAAA